MVNLGNVGIGDSSPSALLSIGSGHALTVDASGNLTTSGKVIGGASAGFQAGTYAYLIQDGSNNTSIGNSSGGGGAIWMGTTVGSTFNGIQYATGLANLNSGNGGHYLAYDLSDGSLYLNNKGSNADVRMYRPTTSTLAFNVGVGAPPPTEMMRLNTTGVGIGSVTPLSKLDVNGGVAIGSYAGNNAAHPTA